MTLAGLRQVVPIVGTGQRERLAPNERSARRSARSRPGLYRAIDNETPVPSRGTLLRSFGVSTVFEQRADIGLGLPHGAFYLAKPRRPRLRRGLRRQSLGARRSRGGAPGADRGGRALERVSRLLPVLLGPGGMKSLDIDW